MRRRDFIAGLGGAAVVGVRGAWAQERVRRMGLLQGLDGAAPAAFDVLLMWVVSKRAT